MQNLCGCHPVALDGAVSEAPSRVSEDIHVKIAAGDKWSPWEWKGQPRSFVFTQKNGQPVRPRLDSTNWKRLLIRAGVPHTKRYASRHTTASAMIADGVDVATVSATMGHASPAFTMAVYVHAIDERMSANADRLEARRAITHPANKVQASLSTRA